MPIKAPSVSIIITNYNYEQYIADAIQSVANQDYQNFECIIVDDASTDNSFEVITEYLNKLGDARFRCLRLGKNSGQMAAFKVGLENTTGQFVGFLDADDLYFPDFITKHIEAHLNHSFSAGFTASDTIQIDENNAALEGTFRFLHKKNRSLGVELHVQPIPKSSTIKIEGTTISSPDREYSDLSYIDRNFEGLHWSATSSLMFRRDLLELTVPADTDTTRTCADYYFVNYCHMLTGSITISSAHSAYRLHRKNNFADNPRVGGDYLAGFFHKDIRSKIEATIGYHCIKNYDRLLPVFGADPLANIVKKYIPEHLIYRRTKSTKLLWRHINRNPLTWFDYAIGAPLFHFFFRGKS